MRKTVEFAHRTLEIRSDNDGHVIEGIAVPYGEVIDTWEGRETFDSDCIFDGLSSAKLCYQHDELIGSITSARSESDGLHITARIADTQTGKDAIELVRNGALDSLSVGFIPIQTEADKDGVTHYKQVRLLETSIVTWPAYSQAQITSQRNKEEKEDTMNTDAITKDVQELRSQMEADKAQTDDALRKLTLAMSQATRASEQPAYAQYRSYGEMIKELFNGSDEARNAYHELLQLRAASNANSAMTSDTAPQPTWVADQIRLVTSSRTVSNLVTISALPAQGQSIEYLTLKNNNAHVAEVAEGADLTFSKIELGTATAQVKTYGGYTKVTRQVIDRSDPVYLNTLVRAMANAYAVNTEQETRTALYEAIKATADSNKVSAGVSLDNMTYSAWVALLVNLYEKADQNGVLGTKTLGVSKDVFIKLATLDSATYNLMTVGTTPMNLGTIDLSSAVGTAAGLRLQLLPEADNGTCAIIAKDAVTMWESNGAPFQLQEDTALDLSRGMSIYGYAAHGVTNPAGIIPTKFGE